MSDRETDRETDDYCVMETAIVHMCCSALGSFYLPMLVMLFFYWRIYNAAVSTTRAIKQGFRTTKASKMLGTRKRCYNRIRDSRIFYFAFLRSLHLCRFSSPIRYRSMMNRFSIVPCVLYVFISVFAPLIIFFLYIKSVIYAHMINYKIT